MRSTQTETRETPRRPFARGRRSRLSLALAILSALLIASSGGEAFAQRSVTQKFRARRNVRLQLTNLSGTVTVEAWNRDEIKVTAETYSPAARITPEQSDDALVIDVRRDNRGRGDVGDVNFRVMVPVNSAVDIETKQGQITITGVRGSMVRAHVWLSGDIELSGIGANRVIAENTTGNIFFDGEIAGGGKYEFKTMQGDVTLRIPADAGFSVMAAAPHTRRIDMGAFASPSLNLGDGRKIYGNVGEARASITVFNQRGAITFLRR